MYSTRLLLLFLSALVTPSLWAVEDKNETVIPKTHEFPAPPQDLHTLGEWEIRKCLVEVPLFCGVDALTARPEEEMPTLLFTSNLQNFGQRAQGSYETNNWHLVSLPSKKNSLRRCLKADASGHLFFAIGVDNGWDPCSVHPEDTSENLIRCYPLIKNKLRRYLPCLAQEQPDDPEHARAPTDLMVREDLLDSRSVLSVSPWGPRSASDAQPQGSWRGLMP